MIDYHTHHYRCGHARGTLEEYVDSAIEKGFMEIGLSDHSPIYHLGDDLHALPTKAMPQQELPRYIEEAQAVKVAYQDRISVRVGVESDYLPGWEEHYRNLWQQYELDYVIGSVHWVDDWHIFSKTMADGHTKESLFQAYLERIEGAALSGVYDIVGHIDALKRYARMPERDVRPDFRRLFEKITHTGVAIEVNTSGWRTPCNEQYPSIEILREAKRHNIPVTLGSDAHDPHMVGANFDKAMKILYEAGYRHLATFEHRELRLVPFSEVA